MGRSECEGSVKGVTIWKDGVELKPLDPDAIMAVSEPASVTVTLTSPTDEDRVRLLLLYAEAQRLPNLRLWCLAWLDPTSDGARRLAEQKLRDWVAQAEPGWDARL